MINRIRYLNSRLGDVEMVPNGTSSDRAILIYKFKEDIGAYYET